MADTCYPVFQEGQTLTRDDLTLLREFFDDRGRQVGRAIGFGIACGLDGEITTTGGAAVVIDAGIGIEHRGEVLTLEAPVRLPLPPTATETGYDFVTASPGGFTVVLVAVDTVTPAPDCDEEGCEGHAATACRTAELVMVPGRLTGAVFDFESEDLIQKVTPLVAAPTANQFEALRTAILTRLDDTLSAAAKAKLTSVGIATTDLTAIKNAKAAFLNQVLFAALDLLRCRALLELGCLREAAKPGVALGWAHQVGGAWQWDCSFRHAWEPPAGLSIALVGGACEDACKEHRDRLESLILTFDLPPVPKPEDPPKGGGDNPGPYVPCHKFPKHSRHYYLGLEDCGFLHVPPDKKLPHDWRLPWTVTDLVYPPKFAPTTTWEVYLVEEPDYFDDGLMVLTDAIGRDPRLAATGIKTAVKEATVEVMSLDAATKQPGFRLTTAASPADTIVLIADIHGKVTDIGAIPAQTGFKNASRAIPAATAAAASAKEIAEGLETTVGEHGTALGELARDVTTLVGFKGTTEEKLKKSDEVFLGLNTQIANTATQVYSQFQTQTAVFLHNAVADGVKNVQDQLTVQMNETVQLATAEIKEGFSRVDQRAVEAQDAAMRANTRVDQVLGGRAIGLTDREIGRQTVFNEGLVGVMQTVSDAIVASAPDAQKGAVEERLKPGRATLDRMEAGVRAGSLVLEDERAPLSELLETFVGALKAAGAPAAQLKQLQVSVKAVQEQLQ